MTNGVPMQQPPDPTLDAVTGGLPLDRFPEPFPAPAPDPPVYHKGRRRKSSSTSSRRAEPPDSQLPEPDTCRDMSRGRAPAEEPLFFPCKCSGSIKHVHPGLPDGVVVALAKRSIASCARLRSASRSSTTPTCPRPSRPMSWSGHHRQIRVAPTCVTLDEGQLWLRTSGGLISGCRYYHAYRVRTAILKSTTKGLGSRSAVLVTTGDGFGVCEAFNGTDVCPSSVLLRRQPHRQVHGNASAFSRLPDPIPQSLLGGVGFLQNLTRHTYFNRFVIHVLEGLIITVLVIVCFILIILVRDYVVQQQPERNLRAAWAAVENPQPPPVVLVRPQVQPQEILRHAAIEADDTAIQAIEAVEAIEADDTANEADDEEEPALRPPPQRQLVVPLGVPPLPRDQGEAGPVFNMEAAHEYLDVFREARGDPQEIMRIARERGLDDRMDYWVQITASMIARERENEGFDGLEGEPIFARPAPNPSPPAKGEY